jgi:hypothetical protein
MRLFAGGTAANVLDIDYLAERGWAFARLRAAANGDRSDANTTNTFVIHAEAGKASL